MYAINFDSFLPSCIFSLITSFHLGEQRHNGSFTLRRQQQIKLIFFVFHCGQCEHHHCCHDTHFFPIVTTITIGAEPILWRTQWWKNLINIFRCRHIVNESQMFPKFLVSIKINCFLLKVLLTLSVSEWCFFRILGLWTTVKLKFPPKQKYFSVNL